MNSDKKYCFSCMGELVGDEQQVCPRCGHDNRFRRNGAGLLNGCLLHGQYLTGRCLGRGGFGATYIGKDLVLDRTIAIKEYLPKETTTRQGDTANVQPLSGSLMEDFEKGRASALHEGRTMLDLGAMPKVVRLFNAFLENNTVYIVMEYIPGETLTKYLERYENKRLPWTEAYRLLGSLLPVLHAIHQRGIIHRDISPDNIMIRSDDGEAVLLDFGISQAIKDGEKKSTSSATTTLRSGYAPIEQYSHNGQQDARTDEYAYCATMYYALTGVTPPDATDFIAYNEVLTPPSKLGSDIPASQEAVLLKGMSLRCDDRFSDMKQLEKAFATVKEEKVKPKGQGRKKVVGMICLAIAVSAGLFFLKPKDIIPNQTQTQERFSYISIPDNQREIEYVDGLTSDTIIKGNHENPFVLYLMDEFGAKLEDTNVRPMPTNAPAPDQRVAMDEAQTYDMRFFTSEEKEYSLIITGMDENFKTREAVKVPEGVTHIGKGAFYAETEIDMDGVTISGENSYLRLIELPSTLYTIDDYAFHNCYRLLHIEVPERVTSIGKYAFSGCKELNAVTLPDGLTFIRKGTFEQCSLLKEVKMPKSLYYIGEKAFYNCSSLEEITIPDNVVAMGASAFSGCNIKTIYGNQNNPVVLQLCEQFPGASVVSPDR
ncbi:MAG: hypothetical protein E7322_04460 [Clostridiales bacterium]|nr:hypothetical protein [Clostridiales bacterium]